jgi:membrane-associated phospholipid phosphatase
MVAMHTIQLIEPSRWMDVLNRWLLIQDKYEWIANLAPTFADVFVVIYPILLVCIYIYAIIKKKPIVKQGAFYVFFVTLLAVLINVWIQTFFYKERPIVVLNQVVVEETLLHDILPTSSFPSDHAVVSMSVAMAMLLWWLYNKQKFFTWSGVALIIISFIMTACRILTLVHWPSDIVAWLWLWIIIPMIVMIRPFRYVLLRCVINPIIRFEQWFIGTLFNYEQPEV